MFGIDSWLKTFFAETNANLLKDTLTNINKTTAEIGVELGKTPENFNEQIFKILESLSENVILPVAILFVSLIITLNLCKSLLDERQRQNPIRYGMFAITSVIAIYLTTNAFDITNAILSITQTIVDNALNVFGSENINLSFVDIEEFIEIMGNMEIGSLFSIWITLFITSLIIWIIRVLVQVIILGRFIEIFLRISLAPIPFSTFFNREFSSIGYNFIKSIGEVSLQAFLIIVVIAIYKGILSSIVVAVGTEEELALFLIKVLVSNLTLIFSLFQTKRIADSILQAH